MSETAQNHFEGWAVLEIMGHNKFAGYVQTVVYGSTAFFRIDVPELPERERVTRYDSFINDVRVPSGSTVKEGPIQAFTKIFGAGSIYCLTPCTEEFARKAAEADGGSRPLSVVSMALPKAKALVEPEDDDETIMAGDHGEDL